MTLFISLLCSKLSMTDFLQNKVLTPYCDISDCLQSVFSGVFQYCLLVPLMPSTPANQTSLSSTPGPPSPLAFVLFDPFFWNALPFLIPNLCLFKSHP